MQYTTTSCANCGYKTRYRESNVPSVQLGYPIQRCPKCGNLIVDSIATEYEFMTEIEKEKFSSEKLFFNSLKKNGLFIVFGLLFFIFGIVSEDGAAGIIFGLISLGVGVYGMFDAKKSSKSEECEQAIYESLQRTKNSKYVDFIRNSYMVSGIQRNYRPLESKEKFLEEHKNFESRYSYKQSMEEFNQVLESLNIGETIETSGDSISNY